MILSNEIENLIKQNCRLWQTKQQINNSNGKQNDKLGS